MTDSTHKKSTRIVAGLAVALSLLAAPSFAQGFNPESSSYNRDGTLNVWGAHIDPVRPQGGLLGGATGAVGGLVGAGDDVVTGSLGGRRGESVAGYDRVEGGYEAAPVDGRFRRGGYN